MVFLIEASVFLALLAPTSCFSVASQAAFIADRACSRISLKSLAPPAFISDTSKTSVSNASLSSSICTSLSPQLQHGSCSLESEESRFWTNMWFFKCSRCQRFWYLSLSSFRFFLFLWRTTSNFFFCLLVNYLFCSASLLADCLSRLCTFLVHVSHFLFKHWYLGLKGVHQFPWQVISHLIVRDALLFIVYRTPTSFLKSLALLWDSWRRKFKTWIAKFC